MPSLEVAQDYKALRDYALAQMEYSARAQAAGRHADQVVVPEIPAAYLGWLNFLARVERTRKLGLARDASFRADVAHGLEILEAARSQFLSEHKQCGGCGNWLSRFAKTCVCGKKF